MALDREEVLRMAREAGIGIGPGNLSYERGPIDDLERLVALAYAAGARAEREIANQEIDELNEVHWRDAD